MQIRLEDLQLPVLTSLRELPQDRYLAAQLIIFSEMRDIYVRQQLMTSWERRLMNRTLRALRATVKRGKVLRRTPGTRFTARAWRTASRNKAGMTGTINVRITFRELSHELAGLTARRRSISRVTIPFVDIPMVTHIPSGLGFRITSNRHIGDDGITAGLLRGIQDVCRALDGLPGPVTTQELDRIRHTAFGEGWKPI